MTTFFSKTSSLYNLCRWVFGLTVCQLWLTLDILTCTSSILNLCAIALDRYWAITDPIVYCNKRTPRLVLSMIGAVWGCSILISVPPSIGWNDWTTEGLAQTCELTQNRGFVVFSAAGSFYIPLVVMTVVYAKIFVAARKRLRKRGGPQTKVQLFSLRFGRLNFKTIFTNGSFLWN